MNLEKTKYLPFSSYMSGLAKLGNLEIDRNTSIPEVESIKYLGVTIDRGIMYLKVEVTCNLFFLIERLTEIYI